MKPLALMIAGFLLGFVISFAGSLLSEQQEETNYVDQEKYEDEQIDALITLDLPETNNE